MYSLIGIILLNIFCYFVSLDFQNLYVFFGLNALFLDREFYWQPITSMFLHANITHLAMNMVVLFQVGYSLIQIKSINFFVFFYLIGGILTSILTFFFMKYMGLNHTVIGASGAICLLMGYLSYIDKNLRKGLFVSILIISFAPMLLGINIAWYAHLIGFGLGFLFGIIKK